ncbi:hypothetical protein B1219_13445 [Pseudomonas ogarae]|nr:hypothetical protein B1219_13445 [Pseudomonas ogarae]OPG76416.1 hypothetical protein B1218_26235 [Pseudomonas ogarae]
MARELAPAGARSGPVFWGAAAQPSGSKLPRHKSASPQMTFPTQCRDWTTPQRCPMICLAKPTLQEYPS